MFLHKPSPILKTKCELNGTEKKYVRKGNINEVILARPSTRGDIFGTDYRKDHHGYALIYPDMNSCWISKDNFEKNYTPLPIQETLL